MKTFPLLGQKVHVTLLTDALVPVHIFGYVIHTHWMHGGSTFIVANRHSRHQIFFFSPLCMSVRIAKPRRTRSRDNRFNFKRDGYERRDVSLDLHLNLQKFNLSN